MVLSQGLVLKESGAAAFFFIFQLVIGLKSKYFRRRQNVDPYFVTLVGWCVLDIENKCYPGISGIIARFVIVKY